MVDTMYLNVIVRRYNTTALCNTAGTGHTKVLWLTRVVTNQRAGVVDTIVVNPCRDQSEPPVAHP